MNIWKHLGLRFLNLFAFITLLGVSRWLAYPSFVLGSFLIYFAVNPSDVEKFLCWALRTREIHKPEGLYLRRYYLSPRWSWLPFQIFLHNILLDDDRNMHDHPWDFWSFILKGCYREFYKRVCFDETHTATRLAPAGTLLRNKAEHIHRVEIVRPVWSLVIASRPRRLWGFWPETVGVDLLSGQKVIATNFVDAGTFLNEPGVQDAFPEDRLSDKAKRKLGIPVVERASEESGKRPAKSFDEAERGWFTDSAKIPDERAQ